MTFSCCFVDLHKFSSVTRRRNSSGGTSRARGKGCGSRSGSPHGSRSEIKLQPELDVARQRRLHRDLAERSRAGQVARRRPEARMVEGIEHLHAEIEIAALGKIELFSNRGIEI